MIQRTHDLAAVALVSYRFLTSPPAGLKWETVLGIGVATILGGLIPDIDNATSRVWKYRVIPWEGQLRGIFCRGIGSSHIRF